MIIEKLHKKAKECVSNFRKAEGELLSILQQIDSQKGFRLLGYASLYQYATVGLKLSEHQAYSLITISRKAKEVPELKKAIDSGKITTSQAKRIVAVVTPETQESWIEKASTLSQKELEKEVVKVCPQAAVIEKMNYVQPDRVKLVCGISEKLMKKLAQVQDILSQKTGKPVGLEEALDSITEFYLEKKDPVAKARRQLSKSSELSLRRVNGPRVPAAVRNTVMARDEGRCVQKLPTGELCGQKLWIEIHHRVARADGGKHIPENLITLCTQHHKMHHDFRV